MNRTRFAILYVCLSSFLFSASITSNWTGAVSNEWNNAGNWSSGIPNDGTSNFDGVINTLTNNPVQIDNFSPTVDDLTLGTGAKLQVTGQNLTLAGSATTGNLSNSGTVTLTNSNLFLTGSGQTINLSGSGTLNLADTGTNGIWSNSANLTLVNGVSHTIAGYGVMEANTGDHLAVTNHGTITANVSGQFLGITGSRVSTTNDGVISAINGGTFGVSGSVNNAGGTISANGGSVQIGTAGLSGSVTGGTLSVSNGGSLQLDGFQSGVTVNSTGGSIRVIENTVNGNFNLSGATTLDLSDNSLNGSFINGTVENGSGSKIVLNNFLSTLSGTLNNEAGGQVSVTGAGGTFATSGLTINNDGAFSISGSANMQLLANTTLNGAGTLTLNTGSVYGSSSTTLTNNSTIVGLGAIGPASGASAGTVSLINNGTINANAGGLFTVQGQGTFQNKGLMESTLGSTLYIAPKSTLNNTGGTILADGGTVQIGSGTIGGSVTGGALNAINGGTLMIIGNSQTGNTLNVTGATINLASVNMTGATVNINNGGLMEFTSGSGQYVANTTINSGGTLEYASLSGSNFTMEGTTNIAQGGTMKFDANTFSNIGNLAITDNGTINVGNNAQVTLSANKTLDLGGTGTLTLSGGTITSFTGTKATLINEAGHTITGNGTISTDIFSNNGTIAVGTGSQIYIKGSGFTNVSLVAGVYQQLNGGNYNVQGTLMVDNAAFVSDNSSITLDGAAAKIVDQNGANGLRYLTSTNYGGMFTLLDGNIFTDSSVQWANDGITNIGQGSKFIESGTQYDQDYGTTEVNGTLQAPTVNVTGGVLDGTGTIVGNVKMQGGTLRPGDDPGTLTIQGNLSEAAETYYPSIEIDLASATSYGRLDVTGSANLAGIQLVVDLLNGYRPLNGTSFDIMDWGSTSGSFSNIVLPTYDDGERFVLTQSATGMELTYFAPEPATWMLGFAGLALAGVLKRRRSLTILK